MNRRSDKLDPGSIQDVLKTEIVGKHIHYFPIIDSTNTIAASLAKNGAKDGTLVIAEEQTKGRGRLDRSWLSGTSENILMSIIFRPQIDTSHTFYITMLASIAIVKAIKNITSIKAGIKWPNDIYIGNKKTAGILTELCLIDGEINSIVVGIGLNVNFCPGIYPEIRDIATSISEMAGSEIPRIELLKTILEEIEKWYSLFRKGSFAKIHKEWSDNSIIFGRHVKIISENSIEEGIADSIDNFGSLIIRDKLGNKKTILCGDVSLRI